jgi:hypothetical protein
MKLKKQILPLKIQSTLVVLSLLACCTLASCKSAPEKTTPPPTEKIETVEKQTVSEEVIVEFTKAKEGFITSSLFQVAISSVLPDADARMKEAKEIAEQKALNLLRTYASPNLSDKGKRELRDISKEGTILDKKVTVGGRFFFLYQIQKRDLKQLVTNGIE